MDGNASGLGCTPRYIGHEPDPLIARQLRTLCLAVILIRAGLEMDPVALYRLSGMVLRSAAFRGLLRDFENRL